jgi:hypothetical protein
MGEIKKKRFKTEYIAIKNLRTKFIIISKEYDISNFFATSGKCFSLKIKGKHFPENQVNFFLTKICFFIN